MNSNFRSKCLSILFLMILILALSILPIGCGGSGSKGDGGCTVDCADLGGGGTITNISFISESECQEYTDGRTPNGFPCEVWYCPPTGNEDDCYRLYEEDICTDSDSDSYYAENGCGTAVDCNDSDARVHPGAFEICDDGIDQNCDGDIDCADIGCIWDSACAACVDNDNDGYYAVAGCPTEEDCDDDNELVNPGETEVPYNGNDDDCNSNTLDDDLDGDGYLNANDCDDGVSAIYPGASEVCDGYDNQCPGDLGYGEVDEVCTTPTGMVLIPPSCFDMGDAFDEGFSSELPVHNVCVSGFNMDVHEVTTAEYAACVNAGECTAPSDSSSFTRNSYYANPDYADFPVIYVSWNQANDYCAWAGKRLPTEAEWEYAARGGLDGKRYPWGDSLSGTDANYWDSGDPWDNDTSEVEHYAANGYGLYDMAGNVWEWVNDWYQSNYYSVSPTNDPTGPASGTNRALRGGSWGRYFVPMRIANRNGCCPPTTQTYNFGFRCAADL